MSTRPKMLLPLLVGMALMLLPLTAGHSLAKGKQGPDNPNRKVIKKIKLKPRKGTEVILPDFTATVYDDDSVSVSASGTYAVDAPPLTYNFEVDIKAGTYSTIRIDPSQEAPEEQGTETETTTGLDLNSVSGNMRTLAINPGDATAKVRVIGRDPGWLVVNQTTDILRWRVYANGTVRWLGFTDTCFAANPTRAGTHWFTTSCSGEQPWYPQGNTSVQNNSSGQYINWDFGNNGWSTESRANIVIVGRNDRRFDYNWAFDAWGEYSWNIWGGVAVN